jgi:MoaD family protein
MRVDFFATYRPLVGGKSLDVPLEDGATVRDLVTWLALHHPALGDVLLDGEGRLSRHTHVFVDGRGVRWLEKGLDTALDGSQKVDVFPAVAGG